MARVRRGVRLRYREGAETEKKPGWEGSASAYVSLGEPFCDKDAVTPREQAVLGPGRLNPPLSLSGRCLGVRSAALPVHRSSQGSHRGQHTPGG